MPMFNVFYIISLLLLSTSAFAEGDLAPESPSFQASAERGKATFDAVCVHCHHLTHEISAVGCPGLEGVLTRHNAEWIDAWLTSPESFAKTNVKAKTVVDANPYGLVMPTLPEMVKEHDRLDIIEFLKTLK
ncbi:MAG: cytochrome c [Zetaproteobacteria bacterium]|nr:cytochrome c [Zetaproteobacteria bacterium]